MSAPLIHPYVTKVLRADADIHLITLDRIYAGRYPKTGVDLPAIRFRFPFADPLTPPTTTWWSFTGSLECHADTEDVADSLGGAALDALLRLQGTNQHGVAIQAVTGWGVQSVEDGEWSPPKPQRIVPVTLTARAA